MFPQNADPLQAQLFNFMRLDEEDHTQQNLVTLFSEIKEKAEQAPDAANKTAA